MSTPEPDDLWEPDPLLDFAASLGAAANAATDPTASPAERQAAADALNSIPSTPRKPPQ
ncbi:hypothetical protein F4556_002336 [Kitasatospora gansuensis]|uniref:Uncharacterized protein n=1 Tax=Kitasatospora gansuensis TaxID=258050 RepID=A0A7W7WH29_9ACTN|nr:hypothetical protein [Kitasatospora gansuensis]MBB4946801.1 hypothetical protein [Kitasatospora gansuensis]